MQDQMSTTWRSSREAYVAGGFVWSNLMHVAAPHRKVSIPATISAARMLLMDRQQYRPAELERRQPVLNGPTPAFG